MFDVWLHCVDTQSSVLFRMVPITNQHIWWQIKNMIRQTEQTSISHIRAIVKRKLLAVYIYIEREWEWERKREFYSSKLFVIHISVSFWHFSLLFYQSLGDEYPTTWYAAVEFRSTRTLTLTLPSKAPAIPTQIQTDCHIWIFLFVWLCDGVCVWIEIVRFFTFARHLEFLLLSGSLIVRVLISFDFFIHNFFPSCYGYEIYDIYVCIILLLVQTKDW